MSTITLNGAKGGGDFLRLRFWGTVLLMLGALLALGAGSAYAAPLAGTSIGNQASAAYTDNNNVSRITVSNSVSTIVQAVGAANLTQTQSKIGAPNQTLAFPHTIFNNGNSPDTFTITAGNVVTAATFSPVPSSANALYADANCDGVADNSTIITSVGPVAPGGQACFVAQVSLATSGTGSFDVGYASSIAGASLQANGVGGTTNTDSVTISNNAVINVTKSINVSTGPSGTIVTYQLTYSNTGTVSAGNVVLADTLPAGAAFVAGSGRWSVATGVTLTDADADTQGTAPNLIDFSRSGQQVVGIIQRVDPGSQGILEFQATLTSATTPTTINNYANWCYSDSGTTGTPTPALAGACALIQASFGAGATPAASVTTLTATTQTATKTNTVPFLIPTVGVTGVARIMDNNANTDGANPLTATAAAGLAVADPDLISVNAGQGTIASWDVFVFNQTTAVDTYNITVPTAGAPLSNFPVGTTFLLLRSDGATPLTDSNSDGVLDTGPVNPSSPYQIRVVAILPPSGAAGTYNAVITAQSTNTTSSTNTVGVRAVVAGSTVDIRNYGGGGGTANGAGGVDGQGEIAPVTTYAANPGNVATFGIGVANTGTVADSFDLAYGVTTGGYSSTAPYAMSNTTLPTGYSLAFYLDNGATCAANQRGAQVSNTGVIAPGATRNICAVVTLPAGASAGNTELFFRALSPTTFTGTKVGSSADVKHDRLTVNIVRSVAITPNNSGQIFPGGSIQYCHTVTNGGNLAEDISIAQSPQSLFTSGAAGWAQYATVYRDANNNCQLDDGAAATTTPLAGAGLVGTINPGTSQNFIVVVQAPAAAAAGQTNNNTFTLTTSTVAQPVLTATANDITAVVVGQVQLVKDQRLDPTGVACSTTFDAATMEGVGFAALFTTTQITTGAIPGACIIYRVKATNVGTQNVTGVTINDVAPPNTALNLAPITGTVNACVPSAFGIAPNVNCTIATLTGGSTTTMYFRVKITP